MHNKIPRSLRLIPFLLALMPLPGLAEAQFELIKLEGTARIQRSQKKTWDDLEVGVKVQDNDIVETFFKTKLIVRYGKKNIAILGSNSKALFNISEFKDETKTVTEASFTLFAGGLFAKAVKNCRVSVYTSNGVAETSQGAVSAVVDAKSGETGFQVLGGSVAVRNIAQQKTRTLGAGQTTMVLPGRAPTAALYLTHKHVSVLKHYFGEEYVDAQLESAGITPTDESAGGGRMSLSQNLMLDVDARKQADKGMYKRLFSLNNIYGSILADRASRVRTYKPVHEPRQLFDNRAELGFRGNVAVANGKTYPSISLTPSFSVGILDLGLRLRAAKNSSGTFRFHSFTGKFPGILDLIDHIDLGNRQDSLFLHLGSIRDLRLGRGLMIDHFDNSNPYWLFQPLGVHGRAQPFNQLTLEGFLADIADPTVGGAHVFYTPSMYYVGAGFYFDVNQFRSLSRKPGNRFTAMPDTVPKGAKSHALFYEADLGVDVIYTQRLKVKLMAEFAQKLFDANAGYAMRIPTVDISWQGVEFGVGFTMETGKTLSPQFTWLYPTNRYRAVEPTSATPRFITQNSLLSRRRRTRGFHLFGRANLFTGSHLTGQLQVDYPGDTLFSDPSLAPQNNFSYHVGISVNDSLVPFLKFGEAYFDQIHGGLYPPDEGYFPSWGVKGGLRFVTVPFLFNVAVDGALEYYYLDLDGEFNNRIDASDSVFEIWIGIRWGFL